MTILHLTSKSVLEECKTVSRCKNSNHPHLVPFEYDETADITLDDKIKVTNVKNDLSIKYGNVARAAHEVSENYYFNEEGDFVKE